MEPVQHPGRDPAGHFAVGNRANPHGRPSKAELQARHVAKAEEIAARWGGLESLDVIERERIVLAAGLLLRAQRPRTQEDQVRLINSADRLIARVEASRAAARPPKPGGTFAEMLAARTGSR